MIKLGVMCFVGGSLRLVDLDKNGFPANSPAATASFQEGGGDNALAAADKNAGPTRDEIREELRKRGIPFKATMSKADLAALLVSGDKRVVETGTNATEATSGEANPDEGTGNQEVI